MTDDTLMLKLMEAIERLLNAPCTNLDDLEEEDIEAIQFARKAIEY
jgi:hypothetical protein